jgi:hypothetical protein
MIGGLYSADQLRADVQLILDSPSSVAEPTEDVKAAMTRLREWSETPLSEPLPVEPTPAED